MLKFLTFIVKLLLYIITPKACLIVKLLTVEKQTEILNRKRSKQVKTGKSDRIIFSILNQFQDIRQDIRIVKPETVLKWATQLKKNFWTRNTKHYPGRPSVKKETRDLVIDMKNNNLFWGNKRIVGELLKLCISLDKNTVRRIINDARKKGKIVNTLTWSKFIKTQINSLYAVDFFTVDTQTHIRHYVYFIICVRTREIVQFAMTEHPVKEFVRQQIIEFTSDLEDMVYMIHDNGSQLFINYLDYGIKAVRTSIKAPNMNAFSERFIRSLRNESLDNFILFRKNQVQRIISEYINEYNKSRPHQGLDQAIPKGRQPQAEGKICKRPILGGLYHDYYRVAEVQI